MPTVTVSHLRAIGSAILKDKEGKELLAQTLWEQNPAIIILIRRPGCVLCRDEAVRLWALKTQMDALGITMSCVVHEWIPREINAFTPDFWPGSLYWDVNKEFYKVLGGGKVRKASLWWLLNPFSVQWQRILSATKRVKQHNAAGDGFILGGVLAVKQGTGDVSWMHTEDTIGLIPTEEEVLKAARAVVQ